MEKIRPQPVDPRVFGQGYSLAWYCVTVVQKLQKSRVGSVTLYPYPYPLQGIFTDLTEVPGRVLNVLQN